MLKGTVKKFFFKLRQRVIESSGECHCVKSLDCYRKSLKKECRFTCFVSRLCQVAANVCDEGDDSFVDGAYTFITIKIVGA